MKKLLSMIACVGALTACTACSSAPKASEEPIVAAAPANNMGETPVAEAPVSDIAPLPPVTDLPPATTSATTSPSLGASSSGRGH